MSDEPLVPVFMPPLAALLTRGERVKGVPLTRDEVLSIRDRGVCIMLRRSAAMELAARRGYDDIDPKRAWEEWQALRAKLSEGQTPLHPES